MFFALAAAIVVILIYAILFMAVQLGAVKVQHTLTVDLDAFDRGRMAYMLLVSGGTGASNMELLGSSLASGFDRTGLEQVRKTRSSIGAEYLGLKELGFEEKAVDGTPPQTVFRTDIPVPGGGMASEGTKAGVTVG
jgi:hypothetical protein